MTKNTKKVVLTLVLACLAYIFAQPSVYAAQRIDVESTAYAQILQNPSEKTIGVDSSIYKTEMNFKIPNTAIDGDYFTLSGNGVAKIPDGHIIKSVEGLNVGVINTVSCVQNIRHIQSTAPDDVFVTLKPEDGPNKCEYKVIFNENVEKVEDVTFSLSFQNAESAGFPILNKDYEYYPYIKVNDEVKWSDTWTVRGMLKTVVDNNFWINSVDIKTDDVSGYSVFGISSVVDLTGKTIEIEIDQDSPVIFNEDKINHASSSNFFYTDASRVNAEGVITNANQNFVMTTEGLSYQPKKAVMKFTSLTSSVFSSSIALKTALDLNKLVGLNNSSVISAKFDIKIKNADGTIFWQGVQDRDVTLIGNTTIADMINKSQTEVPVITSVSNNTSVSPKIETPSTGYESNEEVKYFAIFGMIAVLGIFIVKKLKLSPIKF